VEIWATPPACKSVPSATDTDDDLQKNGWEKVTIGTTPEFEQPFTQAGLRTMRRQYGLQHYVSSTVHGIQGSTLQKLALQVFNKDTHYRLWEKGQLVVLLSRTKRGEHTIFVRDKEETLDMLCKALGFRLQFMEYMEHILDTLSGEASEAPVIEVYMNPYRPCIREGKSPDDKKNSAFSTKFFCKFPLFLRPFPELTPELYKTTAFHHAPLQCETTQWNHLLYFTAISCYTSIGSMKFSGNPHNYCCYTCNY
jgi:hypothetical protein